MIKCKNCGNELRESTKFCSKCGSNVLEQQEKRGDETTNEEKNFVRKCTNCGNEIREDTKFCSKCGNSILEQNEEKSIDVLSEEEVNTNGKKIYTDESIFETLGEFFKEVIAIVKEKGIHIIGAIDKEIQTEHDQPKDSECPYCESENTFPIVKNEVEVNSRGYSLENGCCGMCLLGPFGLLCGLCGSGSKVNSKSITWWGCKDCGKHHLAQHDAIEMMNSFMDKLVINCLCYGSLGSLLLYPILDELVGVFYGRL